MATSATDYHWQTSYDRHKLGGHFLDWANKPNLFKKYPNLKTVPLHHEGIPDEKLSQVIGKKEMAKDSGSVSLKQLCQIFSLAYPLTVKSRYPGGEFLHRSVPSAGGLFPCELYASFENIPDMDDGLYHYSVDQHALVQLRDGKFLGYDMVASHSEASGESPCTLLNFFITAIFYRGAWKYRDRSYRYHLLDTGHLLENLLLPLKALGLRFEICYDFEDSKANHFLGLDSQKEVCLALVRVLGNQTSPEAFAEKIEDLPETFQSASQVSPKEIQYPELWKIHSATSLVKPSPTPQQDMISQTGRVPDSWEKIPRPEKWPRERSYAQSVLTRRSLRNFVDQELSESHFKALLVTLCAGDRHDAFQENSVCMGFIAGNVENIEPGSYWVDRAESSVGLIRAGNWISSMPHICLDQDWLARAAIHVFFAVNLEALEQTWGPRGYRYAMLTAGRLGQRLYLGATALGLGCCGIGAFYDQEASALLELNPESRMLYLLGAGPVKKQF